MKALELTDLVLLYISKKIEDEEGEAPPIRRFVGRGKYEDEGGLFPNFREKYGFFPDLLPYLEKSNSVTMTHIRALRTAGLMEEGSTKVTQRGAALVEQLNGDPHNWPLSVPVDENGEIALIDKCEK